MSPTKRIVVTPAGRKRYLELQFRHLKAQRASFNEWHIWVNTKNIEDIGFVERLAARNPEWIKTVYLSDYGPAHNTDMVPFIHKFYAIDGVDPDALYLRLDDDVTWMQPDFIETIFSFRAANPDYFLVYGNIINNAVTSYIHQHGGNVTYEKSVKHDCFDEVGWKDPEFAEHLHRAFVASVDAKALQPWSFFTKWILSDFERVSVNVISWRGADFAEFEGLVDVDEESFLSVTKPREVDRRNVILGNAIAVHFAFHTQREHLDTTNVLAEYERLAPPEFAPVVVAKAAPAVVAVAAKAVVEKSESEPEPIAVAKKVPAKKTVVDAT